MQPVLFQAAVVGMCYTKKVNSVILCYRGTSDDCDDERASFSSSIYG